MSYVKFIVLGVPSAEVDLISPTKAPEVRPLESSLPHLAHPVDAVQKLEVRFLTSSLIAV